MSLLLEVLVARGRRVQNPREQREVAFGLADLSTNPKLCIRIADKGGIPTLVRLLCVSKDVETQRLCALTLVNLASFVQKPPSARSQTLDGCDEPSLETNDTLSTNAVWGSALDSVRAIIKFLQDDGIDTVTRRYGALILGNLAADVDLHSYFETSNCIYTLVSMLHFAIAHQDLELGRCAALIVSNLSAVGSTFSCILIQHGILEKLVSLTFLFVEDCSVQTQVLVAIRGIMQSDRNSRIEAVQRGVLDSLVLMAQSNDETLKNQVVRTLYCLSCVDENKEKIAQVAFATVLSLALSGIVVVEQYASSTLANVVESLDTHPLVIQHKGILSTLSIMASLDLICISEGCRAMTNLSANMDIHPLLLSHGCLESILQILTNTTDSHCQKYLALCLANFSANPAVHIKVTQLGGLSLLLLLIQQKDYQWEAYHYSLLAFANLTASAMNHASFVEVGGLKEILTINHDTLPASTQFYLARVLRNISSNRFYHSCLVVEGVIERIVRFTLNDDPDIRLEGIAALRSLSAGEDGPKLDIILKGGLNIIYEIPHTRDVESLLEVTAYLSNLSNSLVAKAQVSEGAILSLLFDHVLSEHLDIARQSCACLANIAERHEMLDDISADERIDILLSAMRMRDDSVRREAGRVLANILASACINTIHTVLDKGGHHVFISFLYSRDSACQRVGALGLSNLCITKEQKIIITKANPLEPLRILAHDNTDIECQRLALLDIAKLASSEESHQLIIDERVLNLAISLNRSCDFAVRYYSGFIICSLAQNPLARDRVILEGGMQAIFLLASSNYLDMKRKALPAITSLTYASGHERVICEKGGLNTITKILERNDSEVEDVQLCCCAIANMTEVDEVKPLLVNAGVIHLMAEAVTRSGVSVENYIFRSVCNLSSCCGYSSIIFKSDAILSCVLNRLTCDDIESLLFPLSVMINLTRFDATETELFNYVSLISRLTWILNGNYELRCDNIDPLRLSLLLLLNLSAQFTIPSCNLSIVTDLIVQLTLNLSIEIRRIAIMVLGNFCSHLCIHEELVKKALPTLISSSFPSSLDYDSISHFQALAGMRGLASNSLFRILVIQRGGLEPLFLSLSENTVRSNVAAMRETTICVFNLTFASLNTIDILRIGFIEILLSVVSLGDSICQTYAIASLGNLAETSVDIQKRIIDDGCFGFIIENMCHRRLCGIHEAARLITILSTNCHSRSYFMDMYTSWRDAFELQESRGCRFIRCCGLVIMGNLASESEAHTALVVNNIFTAIQFIDMSDDMIYEQYYASILRNLAANPVNHHFFNDVGILQLLTRLLHSSCPETQLEICLALRGAFSTQVCRNLFIAVGGHEQMFPLINSRNAEIKREVLASFQNLSISYGAKQKIFSSSWWPIILEACRSHDELVAYTACSIVANVSEASEIVEQLIITGLIHSVTFALRSQFTLIIRESVRTISNLSTNVQCTLHLLRFGVISSLMKQLSSTDTTCVRYAAMALSNLTVVEEGQLHLLQEGAIPLLFRLLSANNEISVSYAQHWLFLTLTNLSSCVKCHATLLLNGITDVINVQIHNNLCSPKIKESAFRCLSNLSSNKNSHQELSSNKCLEMIMSISSPERVLEQPFIISIIRGLSQSEVFRESILTGGSLLSLISLCKTSHTIIHNEMLSTLCNVSATQTFAEEVFKELGVNGIALLLKDDNIVSQLFAVTLLGNLTCLECMDHTTIFGMIATFLPMSKDLNEEELLRCVGLSVCNILENESFHADVIREGGLIPLIALLSTDDVKTALYALQFLAMFPSRRYEMVRCGVIEALVSLVRMHMNVKYVEEVVVIFYYLSLEDFCKEFLIKSDFFCETISLTGGVTAMSLRVLSNCSELSCCHDLIIGYVTSLLANLSNTKDLPILRETARLLNNIATSSSFYFDAVDQELFTHYVISFCQSDDEIINGYGHLLILNIQIMAKNIWDVEQRQSLLNRYIRLITNSSFHLPWQNPFIRSIVYLSSHTLLLNSSQGYANMIAQDLSNDNLELGFSVSFALNKSMFIHISGQETSVLSSLLDFISKAGSKISSHAIAVLRKLCYDRHVVDLLQNHFVDALLVIFDAMLKTSSILLKRELIGCIHNMTSHCDCFHASLEDFLVTYMIPSCTSLDHECCRWALRLVANFSENPSRRPTLEVSDVASFCIRQMIHESNAVRREARRLLCNLLSNTDFQAHLLANGILTNYLTPEITEADDICEYYSVLSLNKLASVYSNHETLLCDELFRYLSSITNSCSNNVMTIICKILKLLSTNNQSKGWFVKGKRLEWILILQQSDCLEIGEVIAETLYNLSTSSLLQRWLCEEGMIDHIVKLCSDYERQTRFFVDTCLGVIANLAYDEDNRRHLSENDDLMLLLGKLLVCEVHKLQETAAKILSILTSQRHRVARTHEINLLLSVAQHIKNPNVTTSFAVVIIGNLAKYCEQHLINPSIVKGLTKILNIPKYSRNACKALSVIFSRLVDLSAYFFESDEMISRLICLCSSEDLKIETHALITICNLCSHERSHSKVMKCGIISVLLKNLKSPSSVLNHDTTWKIVQNLSRSIDFIVKMFKQQAIDKWFDLERIMANVEITMWSLCNLCSRANDNFHSITESAIISRLLLYMCDDKTQLHYTSICLVYNLSLSETSCSSKLKMLKICDRLRKSNDNCLKKMAFMIFLNISTDRHIKIKGATTREGRLQWIVDNMKNDESAVKTFACLCFCNLSSAKATLNTEIALEPFYLLLVHAICDLSTDLHIAALLCVVNICSEHSVCALLSREGIMHSLFFYTRHKYTTIIILCCVIANMSPSLSLFLSKMDDSALLSWSDMLSRISSSTNLCAVSIAKSCLMYLAICSKRSTLLAKNVFCVILEIPSLSSKDIERETVSFISFVFSRFGILYHSEELMRVLTIRLFYILNSTDKIAIRKAAAALADISESIKAHHTLLEYGIINQINRLINEDRIFVIKIEGLRALCNILETVNLQTTQLSPLLSTVVTFSQKSDDDLCGYFVSLVLRKVSLHQSYHQWLVSAGVTTILSLLRSNCRRTMRHGAKVFQNLCSDQKNVMSLNQTDGVDEILISLMRDGTMDIKCIGLTVLSILATAINAASRVSDYGVSLIPLLTHIERSQEDLNKRITSVIASISEYRTNQNKCFLIRSVDALIRLAPSDNNEIKQNVSHALFNFAANENNQMDMYHQGAFQCLISLTETNDEISQRYSQLAVCFLMTNPQIHRKILQENDIIHDLVLTANSSSALYQSLAASSIASISTDDEVKLRLIKKGALQCIFRFIESTDIDTRNDGIFTIANFATSSKFHSAVIQAGTIQVMNQMGKSIHDSSMSCNIARFFALLSTSRKARAMLLHQDVIATLIDLTRYDDLHTQQYSLISLTNLCTNTAELECDLCSLLVPHLLKTISHMFLSPCITFNAFAALGITGISILNLITTGSVMITTANIRALMDILSFSDDETSAFACTALNLVFILETPSAYEVIVQSEDIISRFFSLSESSCEVSVWSSLLAVGSLCENDQIIINKERCIHCAVNAIIRFRSSLAILRAAGYLISVIAEIGDYHSIVYKTGALDSIVYLLSQRDEECQEYGAYTVACLSGTWNLQVPITKHGAIRPLVRILASDDGVDCRYYAAIALLRLVDNLENHFTIAQQGGIQALLDLSDPKRRSGSLKEGLQTKASMSLGNVAASLASGIDHHRRHR